MRDQLVPRDAIPAPHWAARVANSDWPRIPTGRDVGDDRFQHLLVAGQLDRFALQLALGYPPEDEELAILGDLGGASPLETLEPAATLEEVHAEQAKVKVLPVAEDLRRYIIQLVAATRRDPRLSLGVSPRGGIALYRMAQGYAAISGRDHVQPDDIKAVALPTLAHRVILETKAKYSGTSKEAVISDVLEAVPVPV